MAIPGRLSQARRRASVQAALRVARKVNLAGTSLVSDPTSLATGLITFPGNPAGSSTITLGGTVVTFGTNVAIGANLGVTLASLLAFLNGSADANISKCTYSVVGTALTVRAKTPNNTTFTLAASAATVSGATLQLAKIRKRKKK